MPGITYTYTCQKFDCNCLNLSKFRIPCTWLLCFRYNKALQMKAEGDQQRVLIYINKAISIRPDDVLFYVERAEAFLRLCDFQSAILNYKKACLLEPANEEFYNKLSFLYYFQGQSLFDQRLYPEALEAFSRAAEMRPDNIGYHIRR